MTQRIKQVRFREYGQPEVLQLTESDLSVPGPDEIIGKVYAAGVNHSDILRRQNRSFMPTPLPFAPGAELAGIILETGEGVSAPFVAGARGLAILPLRGGYATHVKAIDPLRSEGAELQEVLLRCNRMAMEE